MSAPAGFEWVWGEDTYLRWRLATEDEIATRKCRYKGCDGIPVAALNRGRHLRASAFGARGQRVDSWWLYCRDHLYGRRIVDGRIEVKVLRPVDE